MSLLFGRIPADIAQLILERLESEDVLIRALGLSSSKRVAAEPNIYRTIHLTFNDHTRPNNSRNDIHSFFRMINDYRPDLKQHIKSVELLTGVNEPLEQENTPACIPSSPNLSPWLRRDRGHGSLELFRRADLRRQITLGNIFYISEILVSSLPDINDFTTDYSLLEQSELAGIIARLPKLKHLIVRNNLDSTIVCEGDRDTNKWDMSQIFLNPNLRSISTVFNLTNCPHDPLRAPKRANIMNAISLPNLHTLSLIDSTSHPPHLHTLLMKTHHLQKLSYFLAQEFDTAEKPSAPPPWEYTSSRVSSWPALITVLPASLRKLKISVDPSDANRAAPPWLHPAWLVRSGRIESLTRLTHLTKLEVPMYLLFGGGVGDVDNPVVSTSIKLEEILPRGLKKLYLRDDYILERDLRWCVPEQMLSKVERYLQVKTAGGDGLEELRFVLRGRGLGDKKGGEKVFLYQVAGLGRGEHRAVLEGMMRDSGVRITVQVREKSFLSKSGECMDWVKQIMLFKPEGSKPGTVTYDESNRVKRARAFFENVSEEKW